MVRVEKRFMGRVPNTGVALTSGGRAAVEEYWSRLEQLRRDTRQWLSADSPPPAQGAQ